MTDPTYAQVMHNPKDHSTRDIADAAIAHSTRDGRLDLRALTDNLNRLGERRAEFDEHYRDAVRNGQARELSGSYTNRYNLAVRERLGITDPGLMTSFGLMTGMIDQPDHGMHCHVPEGVDFSNLNNTLRANNVVCHTTDAHNRGR